MRVLVTGGSGFIGTNLVGLLLERGHEVTAYDVAEPRDPSQVVDRVQGDLREESSVRAVVESTAPEIVFHLGARTDLHGQAVEPDYAANTAGVRHVVQAVDDLAPQARVVYASSRLVCRIGYQPQHEADYCPPNPYGASKVEGELIVRRHARHPWTILRPTSIWGPWFGVPYRDFFDSVRGGRFVRARGADVPKQFGYVGNTAYQLAALCDPGPFEALRGQTAYLADYEPIQVGDFADRIRRRLGKSPVRQVPRGVLKAGALTGDALKRLGWAEPPLTSFRLDNLLTPMLHDLAPLEAAVGPVPHDQDAGIAATLAWMDSQGA